MTWETPNLVLCIASPSARYDTNSSKCMVSGRSFPPNEKVLCIETLYESYGSIRPYDRMYIRLNNIREFIEQLETFENKIEYKNYSIESSKNDTDKYLCVSDCLYCREPIDEGGFFCFQDFKKLPVEQYSGYYRSIHAECIDTFVSDLKKILQSAKVERVI